MAADFVSEIWLIHLAKLLQAVFPFILRISLGFTSSQTLLDTKAGRSRARINFSRVFLDNKQEKLPQVVSAAKEISVDE